MALSRITINDVAREAGVHRSTVSRALTGSGPVSPSNRERVFAAVKKLNYHPNTLAGALKSKKRNTWGLLSFWNCNPNSVDHFFSKSLGALLDRASKLNYRLLVRNFEGTFGENPDCVNFCHDAQLGGMVLLAPRCGDEDLKSLQELDTPVVLLAYRPRIPGIHFVDLDNYQGARKVMRHLVGLGHRRIAYVGGELEYSANARDRYQGYLDGLTEGGISEDPLLVRNKGFEPAYARAVVRELAQRSASQRPTAVFCATDAMAEAAIEAAKEKGLDVPGDLSVVGFDDNADVHPAVGLTTVRFPFYEAAVMAAEILKEAENSTSIETVQRLIEAELIIRDSTAAP